MLKLTNITLLGLDCIDINRLIIARDICTEDIEFWAVKLLTSIESNDADIVKIDNVDSIEKYSEFIIKKLDDYVDTDFVLIFQYDGFVLSAKNWRDDFFNYDYIGTPWIGYFEENTEQNVGNGGFSLRSKKLLEILAKDNHIKLGAPEDIIISRQYRDYLENKDIKYAPEEIAGMFAIPDIMKQELEKVPWITDEQYRRYLSRKGIILDSKSGEWENQIPEAYKNGDLRWTNQFGFHYLTPGHLSIWLEKHPKYKNLIKIE